MVSCGRIKLTRKRKSVRIEIRPDVYAKLLALRQVDEDGRRESIVATIERPIEGAELNVIGDEDYEQRDYMAAMIRLQNNYGPVVQPAKE